MRNRIQSTIKWMYSQFKRSNNIRSTLRSVSQISLLIRIFKQAIVDPVIYQRCLYLVETQIHILRIILIIRNLSKSHFLMYRLQTLLALNKGVNLKILPSDPIIQNHLPFDKSIFIYFIIKLYWKIQKQIQKKYVCK